MSIPLDPIDTSAYAVNSTGKIDWTGKVQQGGSVGTRGPALAHVRILNESGCGILVRLERGAGDHIPAGGWLDLTVNGDNYAAFSVEYVLAGPSPNLILATVYEPGERVPALPVLGNSPVGVGGTVNTSAGTSIKNDGNGPATSIIEATPSDQAASAIQTYNDGSGFRKVLSANVLRSILNVTRGNATTGKAVVDLGDAGDLTITTYHGQFDAAVSFPVTQIGAGTLPAGVSVPPSRLAAGAIPAGVTLPASQLSAGTAPTGVNLTSVNSDGGTLTSDGAGTLTAAPTPNATNKGLVVGSKGSCFQTDQNGSLELGAGNLMSPGTAQTPYIDFHSSNNALDYDTRIVGSGGNASIGNGVLTFIASYFGFKQGNNTKVAQIGSIPGHGNGDMAIAGSTYWTTQASAGFNNSATFSAFDVAEVYATDAEYPDGTLLCPADGDAGVMTRCTHEGCHAALPVSKEPALGIGDPLAIRAESGETCELLALVGRVRIAASEPIAARALVCSDGLGGVRAMRPGEAGFSLGYALAASSGPAEDGTVGVMVRPQFCIVPVR